MREVEKLETALQKRVEELNVEDLAKISLNENLRNILLQPETLSECLNKLKDKKDVMDILLPISVKVLYNTSTKKVSDVGNEYLEKKISKEDYDEKIKDLLTGDVYQRLLTYYLILAIDPDDAKQYEQNIMTDVQEVKEISCMLGSTDSFIYNNYSVINDLLDLIFPLRNKYYQKYNVDILDDSDKCLSNLLDDLNAFAKSMEEALVEVLKTKDTEKVKEEEGSHE